MSPLGLFSICPFIIHISQRYVISTFETRFEY